MWDFSKIGDPPGLSSGGVSKRVVLVAAMCAAIVCVGGVVAWQRSNNAATPGSVVSVAARHRSATTVVHVSDFEAARGAVARIVEAGGGDHSKDRCVIAGTMPDLSPLDVQALANLWRHGGHYNSMSPLGRDVQSAMIGALGNCMFGS